VVYAGKPPTPNLLAQICETEKPSVICVVPVVIEKIYKKRVKAAMHASRLLRVVSRFPPIRRFILRKAGEKLLAFFGGRLRLLAIGGAPLNRETEEFLATSGVPYLVGYGLTEAAPLLAGGPFQDRTIAVGSTGKPVPGVAIRIASPNPVDGTGEIQAKGDNIMRGYMDHPDLTRQAISPDGWLSTGDLGRFDRVGNLHVTGRLKNVIVLSHGENIYPEAIEEKLNRFTQVAEALVLDRDNRLEAWIYPDYDAIDREISGSGTARSDAVQGILRAIQAEVNAELPAYSKIHRIVERTEPFTKTATQKIKRHLYQA
jgi:long-chain acyl-CoA synthetase